MKKTIAVILLIGVMLSIFGCSSQKASPQKSEYEKLSQEQRNSIAMLSYLTVVSQEIIANKDNRLYLEEVYSLLVNNINPEFVDETTQKYIEQLLDIITNSRLISMKRERIQYIYEQRKAQELQSCVPNPFQVDNILEAMGSGDWKQLAVVAGTTVVDSVLSYNSYNIEIEEEYLRSGWELTDQEVENLHQLRKDSFTYMVEISRDFNIKEDYLLNEENVNNYVQRINDPNIYSKIQHYESEQDTYAPYAYYWLELSHCYFEVGDYKKCLDAVEKYLSMDVRIFRKDYILAGSMPEALTAAGEVYSDKEYIDYTLKYLNILMANSDLGKNWSLHYFAACKYLELYKITSDSAYLDKAYQIAKNNVNELTSAQRGLNKAYLADVQETEIPKDATKENKQQIKDYNSSLNNARKTELAPAYEPLLLNCDLLFSIIEAYDLTAEDKLGIERMLRNENERLFYSIPIENRYTFEPVTQDILGKLSLSTVSIPVTCITSDTKIVVTVTDGGKDTVYEEWILKEVKRPSADVNSFLVVYTNKKFSDRKWSKDAQIKVDIYMNGNMEEEPIVLNFKIKTYDDNWIFDDTVKFEQVQ